MEKGSYKYVKLNNIKATIEIINNHDFKFMSILQYVSVSAFLHPIYDNKNGEYKYTAITKDLELTKNYKTVLEESGYELHLINAQNSKSAEIHKRHVYLNLYKGINLQKFLMINNNLYITVEEKCEFFKLRYLILNRIINIILNDKRNFDINIKNITFDKNDVYFIDKNTPVFTYIYLYSKNYVYDIKELNNTTNYDEEIIKNQLFSFMLIAFQFYNYNFYRENDHILNEYFSFDGSARNSLLSKKEEQAYFKSIFVPKKDYECIFFAEELIQAFFGNFNINDIRIFLQKIHSLTEQIKP